MRINVYDSEIHAWQSTGIQYLLTKNKRQKCYKQITTNTNNEHFQL